MSVSRLVLNHAVVAACLLVLPALHLVAADRDAQRQELQGLAEQIKLERAYNLANAINEPCVVAIHTRERRPVVTFRRVTTQEIKVGDGSGFIFHSDAQGSYILTNSHVVIRTDMNQEFIHDVRSGQPIWHDRIQVEVRGHGPVDATPVGADLQTDLAVIRIETGDLPTVTWADSDEVEIGDISMALGFPFGVGYTATYGKISGIGRETGIYQHVAGYESFLQTDAAINPGNSGGPLVNLRGDVLGVNANIYSQTGSNVGIGFAIPANLARRVAEDLRQDGVVSRPVVGIQVWTFEDEEIDRLRLPNRRAVKISMIMPSSPAEAAGLQVGDAILAVDGERVTGLQHFRTLIASQALGSEVPLIIWRDGAQRELAVEPVSREALESRLAKQAADRVVWRGFGLEMKQDQGHSVRIETVHPDSPASRAGLRPGDHVVGYYADGQRRGIDAVAGLGQLDELTSLVLEVYHRGNLYLIRLRK